MKSKHLIILLLLVFAFANTAAAQNSKDLADIVKKQQAMLDEMQAEIDSLSSTIEDDDDDDLFGNIDIHGFISQGYVKSENANWLMEDAGGQGSFQFNEIGLNFTSQLNDNLRFGMQILSRDYGIIENNRVQVDWAFFDYKYDDWLGLRVGKIKSPAGLMSETRDLDMLRTNIFLPFSNVYNEAYREFFNSIQGIALYGNVDVNELGLINYNVQWGYNDLNPDDGGVANSTEGSLTGGVSTIGEVTDMDSRKAFMSRINWETPLDGLLMGVAYMNYSADLDVETGVALPTPLGVLPAGTATTLKFNDYKTYMASAQYTLGDLVLTGEFSRTTYQTDFAGLRTLDYEEHAWYLMADYRLNSLLSLAAGYSEYINDGDKDGSQAEAFGQPDYSQWTKDYFVSSKFDLTENWVFKAELHFLDGYKYNVSEINPNGYEDRRDVMLALKTTVSF